MKRMMLGALMMILGATGCATTSLGTQDAQVLRAKNKVAPALVHIRPVKEVYSMGKREEIVVTGSGFIISPDGYVVTNEHVAGESQYVKCVLPNKDEVDAEVIGVDAFTDLAVLKLKTDAANLPHVKLGTSSTLEAGQTVLALGSPHGLARSVSSGIVSVTDRYLPDQNDETAPYNNWIQTDAAINPGNSGGPLVNLKGEVIGVNARKLTGADNVGFAIPIDIAKEVIAQLRAHGKVLRSWIGTSFQDMMSMTDDASQKGVLIADVDPLSPAYEAGVQPGDVLLSVNGVPIDARYPENLPAVRKFISELPIGSEAVLQLSRGGELIEKRVTTIERSQVRGAQAELPEWGFSVAEVTPAVARMAQLPAQQGVLVSGAQVGSIAANARLQGGDIIVKMDGRDITDFAQFKQLYSELVASQKPLVLLDVKRGALTRYVLIKQTGPVSEEGPNGMRMGGAGSDAE